MKNKLQVKTHAGWEDVDLYDSEKYEAHCPSGVLDIQENEFRLVGEKEENTEKIAKTIPILRVDRKTNLGPSTYEIIKEDDVWIVEADRGTNVQYLGVVEVIEEEKK